MQVIEPHCRLIILGFCPEEYPMSKRPGRSRLRYQQPTIGFDSHGVLFCNGVCEDGGAEIRHKPKSMGIGYNLLADSCFFTVDGKLKCRAFSPRLLREGRL